MLRDEHIANRYAQVGWFKFPDGTRNNFSEVRTDETESLPTHYSRKFYPASSVGSTPEYKMTFIPDDAGNNWFHFFIGGVDKRNFESNTFAGCGVEQAGEIQNLASQMPGLVGDPDVFTNNYVWDSSSGSYHLSGLWFPLTGDVFQHPAGSFGNATSGSPLSELDIWDNCS